MNIKKAGTASFFLPGITGARGAGKYAMLCRRPLHPATVERPLLSFADKAYSLEEPVKSLQDRKRKRLPDSDVTFSDKESDRHSPLPTTKRAKEESNNESINLQIGKSIGEIKVPTEFSFEAQFYSRRLIDLLHAAEYPFSLKNEVAIHPDKVREIFYTCTLLNTWYKEGWESLSLEKYFRSIATHPDIRGLFEAVKSCGNQGGEFLEKHCMALVAHRNPESLADALVAFHNKEPYWSSIEEYFDTVVGNRRDPFALGRALVFLARYQLLAPDNVQRLAMSFNPIVLAYALFRLHDANLLDDKNVEILCDDRSV